MGYVKPRVNGRFTALYELRPNVYRSAGTYDTAAGAEDAWRDKERELRIGNFIDPAQSRVTFGTYAEQQFLPLQTAVKVNTRNNYASNCRASLIPFFGPMPLGEIMPTHVRLWVQQCQREGKSPATIRTYKGTLATILGQAVLDRFIAINPALGVKTPQEPPRRIRALDPSSLPKLLATLLGPISRTLVELAVHTGLRWGELTELRGKDVRDDEDDEYRVYLAVERAVVDAGSTHTPDGGRFYVESTTKGGHDRQVGLSVAMTDTLLDYMSRYGIRDEDLLFPYSRLHAEWEATRPSPATLTLADMPDGLEPARSKSGHEYPHGTANGYDIARCRCVWCRRAKADQRTLRRASGVDRPANGSRSRQGKNTTDHCPDDWFRANIWLPAVTAANLGRRIVFYDLRHSHATWLAKSRKVDLITLKERMGHRKLATTERYLSASIELDHTAADALEAYMAGAESRTASRRRRRIRAV